MSTEKEVVEITKLDGKNFPVWEFGVTMLLAAKGLTGFTDNTETEPADKTKDDWKTWEKRKWQAAVLLLSSVEKSLHPGLINCKTPSEIWNKLKSLYGDASDDAVQNAWENFYSFRMKDGVSLELQIEDFESLIRKLETSKDKPSEKAIISKLLTSLPPKF